MDSTSTIHRELNARFLAITLTILVGAGAAAFFWHGHQMEKMADAFLSRAETLEANQQLSEAANYLFRYVKVRPEDPQGRSRLAVTYGRMASEPAQKARAVQFYYQALGLSPDRTDLRQRLAELLLELQRNAAAAQEAGAVLKVNSRDTVAARVLALALYGQTRADSSAIPIDRVVTAFEQAIDLNPADADLAAKLAVIYRKDVKPAQPTKADEVMDRLVQAQQGSGESLLARHTYHREFDLPGADQDLDQALLQATPSFEVALAGAERARSRQDWEQAARLYQSAMDTSPKDVRGYLGLGQVYIEQRQPQRAIETWQQGRVKMGVDDPALCARLAMALIEQRQMDEASQLIDSVEKSVAKLAPRLSAASASHLKSVVEVLRAGWEVARGNYFVAIQKLEPIAASQVSAGRSMADLSLQIQVWALLATSYGNVGQWDRAAAGLEHVVRLAPNQPETRKSAGDAWLMAGQPTRAIAHFRAALSSNDAQPAVWNQLAQALLREQTRLPRPKRDWGAFQEALDKLKKFPSPGIDAWQRILLEADFEAACDHQERALELLGEAEKTNVDAEPMWRALVNAYEQRGKPADADRALARYEKVAGSTTQVALVRAEILTRRKNNDQAAAVLQAALKAAAASEQNGLQYRLCQIQIAQGQLAEARRGLAELARQRSADPFLQQELAELALALGDLECVQSCEQSLKQVEGDQGALWRYCRARRLLATKSPDAESTLAEVEQLVDYLSNRRPDWASGFLLKGLLAERRGQATAAIEAYQRAISSGELRLTYYEKLIALLYQQQRFDEAWALLSQLETLFAQSQSLSSLAISVSLKQDAIDRAVGLAKSAVQQRPNDPTALIWLGQTQLLADRIPEAEQTFRKAVQLVPGDVRAWNALFSMFLRTEQRDAARETLMKLSENAKLTDAQRAFVMAQGFELIGDLKEADRRYREAQRLAPNDVAVQKRLAGFLLRTDVSQATESLRRLMELSPESGASRRTLATVLASRGGDAEWQEAMQLLKRDDAGPDETPLDQRLRAMLLMQRGRSADRAEALVLLSELVQNNRKSIATDRLLLAGLYESEGKLQAARDQLLAVANRPQPEASHVAALAEFLLRHRFSNEAQVWIQRLEEIDPGSFLTVSMRARLLEARNRSAEIPPVVEAFVAKSIATLTKDAQKAQLWLNVGNLYTNVSLHAEATKYYRNVQQSNPDLYEPLVLSLGRQNQMPEAISLCSNAARKDSTPRAATVLAQVLTRGQPKPEDFALAEPVFSEALERSPKDVKLLLCLTGVRYLQGKLDEVIELSRRALAIDPQQVTAMNNLASLLAELPESRSEALSLIERAINLSGKSPMLLDTKGMVLFHQGKADLALPFLEEAAALPSADPRYQFHLALVNQALRDLDRARESLQKAQSGGLSSDVLTPLERGLLNKLEQALGQSLTRGTPTTPATAKN